MVVVHILEDHQAQQNIRGGDGGNSTLTGALSITTYGGGGGNGFPAPAGNGGSGGGAGNGENTAGKGVYPGSPYVDAPRQGYDGGASGGRGGGGGGAGGTGAEGTSSSGGDGGGYSVTINI